MIMEKFKNWASRLSPVRNLLGDKPRGQVMVVVALAITVLLIVAGLGVDLGLYYIERVRIVQAVDAAALASASELPFEPAAHQRALEFLLENGYDYTTSDARVVVNTPEDPYGQVMGASEENASTIIEIDTANHRDDSLPPAEQLSSAYRIEVSVTERVPVIFLRLLGFDTLDAFASATAENINNLDIVIVFDKSGSMEFDTLCYGCWEPMAGTDYPGGWIYPLPWNGPQDGSPEHCGPLQSYEDGGEDYYFIEAEEYSRLTVSYERVVYNYFKTYWVLQRQVRDYNSGRTSSRDDRPAYIAHMPFPEGANGRYGVSCNLNDIRNGEMCNDDPDVIGGPYRAPRADYDFVPPDSATYYVWIRAQAGTSDYGGSTCLYWGMDGNYAGAEDVCGFERGLKYDGADEDRWEWIRAGSFYGTAGTPRTLNIWAGGSGIAVDLIAITTDSASYETDPLQDWEWEWDEWHNNSQWANGRTDWACSTCDPRFGGNPGGENGLPICPAASHPNPDRRTDDIYDDEQPIRTSLEASKYFVEMLDPDYDQIGFVRYNSSVGWDDVVELQCLRELGKDDCDEQDIQDTVIATMDGTSADGGTDIAEGMMNGIDVLSTQSGHNGRPGAAHVMIVMTDGRPNNTPNSYCDDDPDRQWPGGGAAQHCVIYYAHEARDNNIVVYTISIGKAADFELMQAVADITGGVHKTADRPDELYLIFDELYERIFLRLVH